MPPTRPVVPPRHLRHDLDRSGTSSVGAVAELAVDIAAPTVDDMIGRDAARVRVPRADVVEGEAAAHWCGFRTWRVRAISELAELISSPALYLVIHGEAA